MSKSTFRQSSSSPVVSEDYVTDRTLDRLVDIGGQQLPAYPNHPLRRLARSQGTVKRHADEAQQRRWYKAGLSNNYARGRRHWAEYEDAYARGWHPLAPFSAAGEGKVCLCRPGRLDCE